MKSWIGGEKSLHLQLLVKRNMLADSRQKGRKSGTRDPSALTTQPCSRRNAATRPLVQVRMNHMDECQRLDRSVDQQVVRKWGVKGCDPFPQKIVCNRV